MILSIQEELYLVFINPNHVFFCSPSNEYYIKIYLFVLLI